jgi:hypothetical protein|tara:strand:- start:274 stop:441 length:168 start_codon:yes stop_codon:yes gene_type:complete
MKNRTTIQVPKEIQKLLKQKKLHPREPYGDMMERTLKENENLKKKIKAMLEGKIK